MTADAGGAVGSGGETDVSSNTVSIDGTSMHYLTAGEGRPLVLLHGGIIDAADLSWGSLIGPLAEDAHVYAPDLLGYGRSELPRDDLSVSRHVEAIGAFLDELDIENPVVAGISLGGGIATGLALEYPERVGSIVPIDAFALGSELPNGALTWLLAKIQVTNNLSVALTARSRRFAETSLASLAYDAENVPEWAVDRVMQEARRPNAGIAFRQLRASEVARGGYRTDYSDRVADLSVPAHFVHGRDDELIPPEWSERAAERADAELTLLEACGHLATLEKPEDVRHVVRNML